MQGHKKVSISRQERPHGAAAHAAGVDALAQHFGDFEDHVFFARAAWANGTRVLAAMARVQRDHDQPVGAWWLGCLARAARVVHEGAFAAGQVGSAGRWRGQRQVTCAGLGLPGDQIAQGVIHCGRGSGQVVHGRRGFGRGALLDQLLQRVNGLAGVKVTEFIDFRSFTKGRATIMVTIPRPTGDKRRVINPASSSARLR